jgi:hypothetical protein
MCKYLFSMGLTYVCITVLFWLVFSLTYAFIQTCPSARLFFVRRALYNSLNFSLAYTYLTIFDVISRFLEELERVFLQRKQLWR